MTQKIYNIENRVIRIKQLLCILLFLAFFPVVRANASETADSVYFHVTLDTLGSLRAGQVQRLTYVLANSEIDSVSYPEFNDSIEVVSGPEPHKGSTYAIINGEEHSNSETGFAYLVRFREIGETRIPGASVTAGGKTYTTPECRVDVHPAEVDMSKVECRLTVEQLKSDKIKYRAVLTCNACPDQNPPMLTINGTKARPNSNGYSSSEGKQEYTYDYYFTSDGYDVSCEELTFGGKPYTIKPRKSKLDDAPDYCCIVRTDMVACLPHPLPGGEGCRSCRVCTGKEDTAPDYQLGVHPLRRIAHADVFCHNVCFHGRSNVLLEQY